MGLKESLAAIQNRGHGDDTVRKLLEPIQKATIQGYIDQRTQKRLAAEQAIVELKLDPLEAAEMVDAIAASLKLSGQDCTEALLYASFFKQALERLDAGYGVDAEDTLNAFLQAAEKRARRLP